MNENTETLTMVKSEKAVFKNDIHKFKASSSLFDDLCDLASRVRNLPAASDAKNILKSQLRVLSSKYEEIFEPQFLTQRFEEFTWVIFADSSKTTFIIVCFPTLMTWLLNPTYENRSESFSFKFEMAYFPFIDVMVPFVEPNCNTDTPGRGFPSLSTTLPFH